MGNKRGQVTLFIIIAIVIVAAMLFGWFAWQDYQKNKQKMLEIETETAHIKGYLQDCLKNTATDGLCVNIPHKFWNDIPFISCSV